MDNQQSVDQQPVTPEPTSPQSNFPRFKLSKFKFFYIFASLLMVFGLGVSVLGLQQIQDVRSKAAEPNEHANPQAFIENPSRGLHWGGLKENKGGPCKNLLEVIDKNGKSKGCTHGPDPAPAGLDARQSVEPLSLGEEGTLITAATIPCEGDGQTGYRVQGLYVHAADKPSRYALFASSFQQYAQVVDTIFSESAAQTGGVRHVRFVTDTGCRPIINDVVVSPTGDDNFGNMTTELQSLGYNRSDRKYLIWADATVYCGLGSMYIDDSPGQTNWNNTGPLYARVDSGCWGGPAEAHEVMHNMGGVQNSAPHASGGLHCTDEYDRMCYDDDGSGPVTMTISCSSSAEDNHFDCNKDDYFNTNPPIGSYLTTHWNTANNKFLIGAVIPTPTPTITPTLAPSVTLLPTRTPTPTKTPTPTPLTDSIAPVVTINSPSDGTIIDSRVTITAVAKDNVGVVKTEIYIDGTLRATATSGSISTNWNSRKASKGTHTILVKATDAKGNVGNAIVVVYK